MFFNDYPSKRPSPLMDDYFDSQLFLLQAKSCFLLRLPTAVLGSIHGCLSKRPFTPQPMFFHGYLSKRPFPAYGQLFQFTTVFSTGKVCFCHDWQRSFLAQSTIISANGRFLHNPCSFMTTSTNGRSPLMDDYSGSQLFYLQLRFLLPRLATAVLGSIYGYSCKRPFTLQPKQ